MSRQALPAQKGRGLRLVVGAIVAVELLALVYLGTGLSTGIGSYTTTDTLLVGVAFDVTLENNGLAEQTKEVHCEVRTAEGTYQTAKSVTVAAGETVKTSIVVFIPLFNPSDVEEKRCYTTLF